MRKTLRQNVNRSLCWSASKEQRSIMSNMARTDRGPFLFKSLPYNPHLSTTIVSIRSHGESGTLLAPQVLLAIASHPIPSEVSIYLKNYFYKTSYQRLSFFFISRPCVFFYKKGVFFLQKGAVFIKKHVFIKFKDFGVKNHTDFINPICLVVWIHVLVCEKFNSRLVFL